MDVNQNCVAYQESIAEMQQLVQQARTVRDRVWAFAEFLNGPSLEGDAGALNEPARSGFLGVVEGSCAALRWELNAIDAALQHAQRNGGPQQLKAGRLGPSALTEREFREHSMAIGKNFVAREF